MKIFFLLILMNTAPLFAGSCEKYIDVCVKKPWGAYVEYRLFQVFENESQYPLPDLSNVVRTEHGITLTEAMKIALKDSEIRSFSYAKGDAVFFRYSDKLQLEEAPGSADTYVKFIQNSDPKLADIL